MLQKYLKAELILSEYPIIQNSIYFFLSITIINKALHNIMFRLIVNIFKTSQFNKI